MTNVDSLKQSQAALLAVRVDDLEVGAIRAGQLPCELTPSVRVHPGSIVRFIAGDGTEHVHALGEASGWAHFSVRVHASRACQADCIVSGSPRFDPEAFNRGEAVGIRFQPFFLPGSAMSNAELKGKGLFARGLHFSGTITPGNTLLSSECDSCRRSFLIRSYHAGYSNSGYFYSASGKYTLTVPSHLQGAPAALAEPEPDALAALEAALPAAPDGTRFAYRNPFRCPHCSAPYIAFSERGSRSAEYYGNYFVGAELLRYEPAGS